MHARQEGVRLAVALHIKRVCCCMLMFQLTKLLIVLSHPREVVLGCLLLKGCRIAWRCLLIACG